MQKDSARLIAITILSATCIAAFAATPMEDFDEAVRLDLTGQSKLAFSAYLRAANAGLPQAQFDVAVMLDSGRGVEQNMTDAALWYARAAAHDSRRAAYNLGQLYEAGEGVPQNSRMAHSWFSASGLPASATHHFKIHESIYKYKSTPTAPDLIYPPADSNLHSELNGIVLVWTSKPQPVPVTFYVELRREESDSYHEIFSGITEVSSIFATLPEQSGVFAWRVTTVSKSDRTYTASEWFRFNLLPYKTSSERIGSRDFPK